MSFDRELLGKKIKKYREQFEDSISKLSNVTGISIDSLISYENGEKEPSGDEILILADYFKCDYKFFISNEKVAPFEQTETLDVTPHPLVLKGVAGWEKFSHRPVILEKILFYCCKF